MNPVELAKIKDYIEYSIRETKLTDQAHIAAMLEPVLIEVKSRIKQQLLEVNQSAEGLRQIRFNLTGENWLNFFKCHDYNPAEIEFFAQILARFSSWKYPGLALYPGVGKVLHSMVSSEPLYIADIHDDVLQYCAGLFNQFYSEKRLMKYKISKYDLSPLPQAAFGIVVSVNWTVFENLEGLTEIARNVHNVLLPGGVFLFNYNPLDRYWGVEQNITQFGFGAETEDIVSNLQSIGFEVEKINQSPRKMAYIICKKQGELDSPKLTSILAKIIANTEELI